MGAGARKRAKERRDKEKNRRKAVNKARYESKIGTAANRKRTSTGAADGSALRKGMHEEENCGNVGCKQCNVEINKPQHLRNRPRFPGF